MSKQTINLGAAPTGIGGDTPRSAFQKSIENFTELYAFLGGSGDPVALPAAIPVNKGGTGVATMAALLSALQSAGGYGKSNIVGPVSQSAGVPTGAVMEAGRFSSGYYFRFANGFAVCLGTLTYSGTGAGTRSTTWSFPASFNAGPAIYGSLASYGTVARFIGCSAGNIPDGFGAPDLSIIVSEPSAGAITVNVMAVGRWFT